MNQPFDPDKPIDLFEALKAVFGNQMMELPMGGPSQRRLKNAEDADYIGDAIEQQRIRFERADPTVMKGISERATIENEDMWKTMQGYLTHKFVPQMTSQRNTQFLARIGVMSFQEFNALDVPTRVMILNFIEVALEEIPKRELLAMTLAEVFAKSDKQDWSKKLEGEIPLSEKIMEREWGINHEATMLIIAAKAFSRFRDHPNIVEAARWLIGKFHTNSIPTDNLQERARFFAVTGWLNDLVEAVAQG